MASWIAKAALQRLIGSLPNATALNEWFQRHVTHSLALDADGVRDRLANAAEHLARYRAQAGRDVPPRVLDIGTGAFAFLPVVMHLVGADETVTVDVARLLHAERFAETLRDVAAAADRGDLDRIVPSVIPERLAAVRRLAEAPPPLAEMLAALGVRYHVRPDTLGPLPDRSADLVASSVVLEYLEPAPLAHLFAETRRVGAAGAVHSHEIDLQDQFAYRDASISPVHFLRFSDAAWRLIRSPLAPMSRMRASEIRAAARAAGLAITAETTETAPPHALDGLPLAERFRAHDEADLRTTRLWFTAAEAPTRAR